MAILPTIFCFTIKFLLIKPIFILRNNIFQSEWFGGELGDGKVILDEECWSIEFSRWKLMGKYIEPLFVYYPTNEIILMRIRNIHFILAKSKLECGDWNGLLSFLSNKSNFSENSPIILNLGSLVTGKICMKSV